MYFRENRIGPQMTFGFIDYLAAKKSVDDRALNRHVLESLAQCLEPIYAQGPLHI
jgi:hypothetical protein